MAECDYCGEEFPEEEAIGADDDNCVCPSCAVYHEKQMEAMGYRDDDDDLFELEDC